MPRPRRLWKKRPVRRYRRRGNRRSKAKVNINRALQPIPQRYICKQKYAEAVVTDATGAYVFNLNSVYDPNRTGIGHQPYAYDTLATLYNRYRVISCGWRIQHILNPGATASRVVACIPSNDPSISWNIDEMIENPRSKYMTLNVGGPALTLSGKCYLPSLMGRTKAQYMADDRYQSDVTTSPAETALLYIKVTDNAGNPINATGVQVLLEYTVEWFDIKRLVQS